MCGSLSGSRGSCRQGLGSAACSSRLLFAAAARSAEQPPRCPRRAVPSAAAHRALLRRHCALHNPSSRHPAPGASQQPPSVPAVPRLRVTTPGTLPDCSSLCPESLGSRNLPQQPKSSRHRRTSGLQSSGDPSPRLPRILCQSRPAQAPAWQEGPALLLARRCPVKASARPGKPPWGGPSRVLAAGTAGRPAPRSALTVTHRVGASSGGRLRSASGAPTGKHINWETNLIKH